MHIGPFSRSTGKILSVFLCHITLQCHPVQGPLVPAGCALHDSCQHGLGAEEAPEPQRGGQGEVPGPGLQLADSGQELSEPGAQAGCGRVGSPQPGLGHRVQEEGALQGLHGAGHGQFPLGTKGTVSSAKCPAGPGPGHEGHRTPHSCCGCVPEHLLLHIPASCWKNTTGRKSCVTVTAAGVSLSCPRVFAVFSHGLADFQGCKAVLTHCQGRVLESLMFYSKNVQIFVISSPIPLLSSTPPHSPPHLLLCSARFSF